MCEHTDYKHVDGMVFYEMVMMLIDQEHLVQ